MKRRHIFVVIVISVIISIIHVNKSSAASVSFSSHGSVGFIPSNTITPPFDPIDPNPDYPVNPVKPDGGKPNGGNPGPLSIDFVSSISFGKHKIVNHDVSYFAKAQALINNNGAVEKHVPNYVQVTDNRGNSGGWTLSVSQEGQLKAKNNSQNNVLRGAEIKLTNPVISGTNDTTLATASPLILDPSGAHTVVMFAKQGNASGTWITHWGTNSELKPETDYESAVVSMVNPSISLTIPGKTPRDATKYVTTFNWTLSNIPDTIK